MINDRGTTKAENITALRMISQVTEDIHILILAHLYDPAKTEFTISGLSNEAINPGAATAGANMMQQPLVEKIRERGVKDDNGIPIKQGS